MRPPSTYLATAQESWSDEIPHGDLPQPTSTVLELIPQVTHVDMHSDVVEQLSLESREVVDVPKDPDATTTLSSPVAHNVVQVISNELISFASSREESLVQHDVAHIDVQSSPPIYHTMV